MTKEEALEETRKAIPEMAWHQMPVSKYSASFPDRLTRCVFCLKFFEILENANKSAT